MKFSTVLAFAALFFVLSSPTLLAKSNEEYRSEADQYYSEQNFKKAYKIYFKLAKMGDHYSQGQLANMLVNGEGKEVDLEKAYGWSTLAAEGGDEMLSQQSDELLEQISDKAKAEQTAARLMKKYGQDALEEKARKRENRLRAHEIGGCTGSKLGCSGS